MCKKNVCKNMSEELFAAFTKYIDDSKPYTPVTVTAIPVRKGFENKEIGISVLTITFNDPDYSEPLNGSILDKWVSNNLFNENGVTMWNQVKSQPQHFTSLSRRLSTLPDLFIVKRKLMVLLKNGNDCGSKNPTKKSCIQVSLEVSWIMQVSKDSADVELPSTLQIEEVFNDKMKKDPPVPIVDAFRVQSTTYAPIDFPIENSRKPEFIQYLPYLAVLFLVIVLVSFAVYKFSKYNRAKLYDSKSHQNIIGNDRRLSRIYSINLKSCKVELKRFKSEAIIEKHGSKVEEVNNMDFRSDDNFHYDDIGPPPTPGPPSQRSFQILVNKRIKYEA